MGIGNALPVRIKVTERTPGDDVHLRSAIEINGYRVHAANGMIGHITDFMVDDETWQLVSIVVDTHDWFGGQRILIDMGNIQSISFPQSEIFVNLSIEAINAGQIFEAVTYSQP
jgi:hypothetical protein